MTLEHDEVRKKVIAATLALMDEGGLEEVKARAIARRVGISVGSIYNMFGSVDDLLQVANTYILADMSQKGQINAAECENELTRKIANGEIEDNAQTKLLFRFLSLAKTYMDFVENNANRWGAMLAFNQNRSEGVADEWYMDQQAALFGLVGNVLATTDLGKDKETRMIAARALWSAVHGIVTMNYVGQASKQAREFTWQQIELLVTVFVAGVFAQKQAQAE